MKKRFGEISTRSYFHIIQYKAGRELNFTNSKLDCILHFASNANPNAYSQEYVSLQAEERGNPMQL